MSHDCPQDQAEPTTRNVLTQIGLGISLLNVIVLLVGVALSTLGIISSNPLGLVLLFILLLPVGLAFILLGWTMTLVTSLIARRRSGLLPVEPFRSHLSSETNHP